MRLAADGLCTVLVTLWVGSLWSVGYLVAPTLFSALEDRAFAGRLAGELFGVELYVALACAPLLVACELMQRRRGFLRLGLPLGMLASIAVIDLILRPLMAGALPGSSSFAWLHGAAASLYFLASLLGLALVLARPTAPTTR